jgi:membrane-associated progesterone receptor component
MWEVLNNPLNLLLLAVLVYFISVLVYPPLPPSRNGKLPSSHTDDYNWLPDKYPDCLVIQSYTKDEIAKYDGRQEGGRILLAIQDVERPKEKGGQWTHKKRTVFDVTRGGQFYGPGEYKSFEDGEVLNFIDGPYGNFAGRDASRGMAKQSFDEGMQIGRCEGRKTKQQICSIHSTRPWMRLTTLPHLNC